MVKRLQRNIFAFKGVELSGRRRQTAEGPSHIVRLNKYYWVIYSEELKESEAYSTQNKCVLLETVNGEDNSETDTWIR